MLTVGLIGCGYISSKHIQTLSRFQSISLVAVSDIDRNKMQEAVTLYQRETNNREQSILCFTDYQEMLKDDRIDVIIIAVVSSLHAAIAKAALQAKKHIIVEKPLALSLRDADEMEALAKIHDKKILVCHQLRYLPIMQEVFKLVERGCFGNIHFAVASLRLNRSPAYYSQSSWRGTWEKDGGMLVNQGIHLVDLLIWLMGDIHSVYGEIATSIKNKETEDIAAGIITFKNGSKGLIEANTITQPKNLGYTFTLFGEKGTIQIGGKRLNEVQHCYIDNGPEVERDLVESSRQSDEHYAMYQDFFQAITKNQHHLVDALEGRRALETIFAIYQSSLNKAPVYFPINRFSTTDMLKAGVIIGENKRGNGDD